MSIIFPTTLTIKPDNVICNICHTLKLDNLIPENCQCATHIICYECFEEMQKREQHHKCCVCRSSITRWVRAHIVNQLIRTMEVKCSDCDQKVQFDKFKDHLKECPAAKFKCPNTYCNVYETRDKLPEHERVCDYAPKMCPHCNNFFVRGSIKHHTKNCNYKPAKCHKCDKEFKHEWLRDLHSCE